MAIFDVRLPPGISAPGFKPSASSAQLLFVPDKVMQQQGQAYVLALMPRAEIDDVIDMLIKELEDVRIKAKELLQIP
jgi:hypothetical protein